MILMVVVVECAILLAVSCSLKHSIRSCESFGQCCMCVLMIDVCMATELDEGMLIQDDTV